MPSFFDHFPLIGLSTVASRQSEISILMIIFKTVIPRAYVEYEVIIISYSLFIADFKAISISGASSGSRRVNATLFQRD